MTLHWIHRCVPLLSGNVQFALFKGRNLCNAGNNASSVVYSSLALLLFSGRQTWSLQRVRLLWIIREMRCLTEKDEIWNYFIYWNSRAEDGISVGTLFPFLHFKSSRKFSEHENVKFKFILFLLIFISTCGTRKVFCPLQKYLYNYNWQVISVETLNRNKITIAYEIIIEISWNVVGQFSYHLGMLKEITNRTQFAMNSKFEVKRFWRLSQKQSSLTV